MAITIEFSPTNMTSQKYDEVIRRLEHAGAGSPPGRVFHTCFGPDDKLKVVNVWASQAEFEQFASVLVPILTELEIDTPPPDVQPQHHSIPAEGSWR